MTDYIALADSLRAAFDRDDIDWDDLLAAERALRAFAGGDAMTDYIALARECGAYVSPSTMGYYFAADQLAAFAARIAQAAPEDERKQFEMWRRQTAKMDPDAAVALEGFGDDADYVHRATRAMWLGWKGRAALSVAPIEPALRDCIEGWLLLDNVALVPGECVPLQTSAPVTYPILAAIFEAGYKSGRAT